MGKQQSRAHLSPQPALKQQKKNNEKTPKTKNHTAENFLCNTCICSVKKLLGVSFPRDFTCLRSSVTQHGCNRKARHIMQWENFGAFHEATKWESQKI